MELYILTAGIAAMMALLGYQIWRLEQNMRASLRMIYLHLRAMAPGITNEHLLEAERILYEEANPTHAEPPEQS